MKGSGTRLHSSIANGGKGRRTRKEAPDETIWFDETKKITDTTENTPPVMNLSGHRLLSAESLQQFIESNSSCSKCSEKLRLQAYNIAYKQGMADLQTYLIQKCQGKRSIEDKYNEFIESHDSFIDSTESSESPSKITRLIVADNVRPRNNSGAKKANHECLPLHIKEPVFLSDPSHRVRVLIRPCFLMSRGPKCDARLTKNDCLRLKIYYGCFIKKNRHKPFEDFRTASMAPIHHLFDSHEHCNPEWCPAKANKRVSKGKYRNIEDNKEMFDWLIENVSKKWKVRSSKHYIIHSIHK